MRNTLFCQAWLGDLLRSAMPDPSTHFVLTYFIGYTATLRSCAPSGDKPHFQISSTPRPVFYHQLHSLLNLKHDGSVASWAKAVLGVKQRPDMARCWRTVHADAASSDGGGLYQACGASASVITIHLSLPILLLIDLNQEGGQEWNCADRIVISQKTKHLPAVVYHLVARIFHSTTKNHYVSRFRTNLTSHGRPVIYMYDDMLHGGYAEEIPGAKVASHLAGTDSTIHLPPSFSTSVAVYQLHGGTSMQQELLKMRLSQLAKDHQVRLSHETISSLPATEISLSGPQLHRVSDGDRYWLSETRRHSSGTSDYTWGEDSARPSVKTGGLREHGHPQPKEDKQSATLDSYWAQHSEETPQENRTGDAAANQGSPQANALPEVGRQRPSRLSGADCVVLSGEERIPILAPPTTITLPSDETAPPLHREDSPFPFRCRCGASVDDSGGSPAAFDSLDVIRCDADDCHVWSHLSCQFQGRASNLGKNGTFFCDDCDPRYVLGMLRVHP